MSAKHKNLVLVLTGCHVFLGYVTAVRATVFEFNGNWSIYPDFFVKVERTSIETILFSFLKELMKGIWCFCCLLIWDWHWSKMLKFSGNSRGHNEVLEVLRWLAVGGRPHANLNHQCGQGGKEGGSGLWTLILSSCACVCVCVHVFPLKIEIQAFPDCKMPQRIEHGRIYLEHETDLNLFSITQVQYGFQCHYSIRLARLMTSLPTHTHIHISPSPVTFTHFLIW